MNSLRHKVHEKVAVPEDVRRGLVLLVTRMGREQARKAIGVNENTYDEIRSGGLLTALAVERIRARLAEIGG